MWRFFTFRVDTQITNFGSFWSTRLKLKRLRTKALGNSKCRTFSVLHEKFLLWPHHTLTHTHTLQFFFCFQGGRSVVDRTQTPKSQTHHTLQATHKRLEILLSDRRGRHCAFVAPWCWLFSIWPICDVNEQVTNQKRAERSLYSFPYIPLQPHFLAKSGLNFLPSLAQKIYRILFSLR